MIKNIFSLLILLLVLGCKTGNQGGCGGSNSHFTRRYFVAANNKVYECADYLVETDPGGSFSSVEHGAFTVTFRPSYRILLYERAAQRRGKTTEIVCDTYEITSTNIPNTQTNLER